MQDSQSDSCLDEIGNWTEIKLEIIRKYASAYSRILSSKGMFRHIYVDGFCGSGEHVANVDGRTISGSPKIALEVDPPFKEYHFIDMNQEKVNHLKEVAGEQPNVHYYIGDCNQILLERVFTRIKFEEFARGLCLLDPYGLQLDWAVVQAAGHSRAIEMFINFPTMDINRNVLWGNPSGVSEKNRERMTRFWGDLSWQQCAYQEEQTLFGTELVKNKFQKVVDGYRRRLKDVAGFKYIPMPLPMRNSKGAIVYYLFFASCNEIANKIVNDIFDKYRGAT